MTTVQRATLPQVGKRPRPAPVLAMVLVLISAACGPRLPNAGEQRPDVILITVDALRADSLSCAGSPLIQTPNLDRLASEGILFSQAMSSFVGTTAAMPSLMSGLFPSFEGITEWSPATHSGFRHLSDPGENQELTDNVLTLAEILAADGYTCAGFSSNPNLTPQSGFDQGFHHFEAFSAYLANKARNRRHPLLGHYPPADVVVDSVLQWLAGAQPRPLFLWLHLMEPHSPYLPPPPFDRLPHRRYTPATDLQINEALYRIVIAQYGLAPPPQYAAVATLPASAADSLEHLKALYEGQVRFADRELGRLFAGLRDHGRWDRSVVIATADHGEELFDHGHVIHHLLEPALEELLRIPLLLRLPSNDRQGRRIHALVRMVDVAPTVLDYTGIPMPASGMDGTSLRPLIEGQAMPELTAFVSAIDFGVARSSRWKYRRVKRAFGSHRPGESLFDIQADPLESNDVAAEQPAALADMRGRYAAFVHRLELRGAPAQEPDTQPADVDPEVRERLRALGYIDE